jgi:hypothetical protein
MAPARNQPQRPVIRVAPLGELNAYMIYEHELETLAEGSPGGLFLNFALALLPTAVGIIVALRSGMMTDLYFMLFTAASIIFLIAGAICLALWWRTRKSVSTLVEEIKKRMPPQGIQTASAAPPASNPPAAAP